MDVRVFDHGRLFCYVLARKDIAGDGECAAMPGVECGLGSGEDVGAINHKLGTKQLRGSG